MRVLIVDDDVRLAAVLQQCLQAESAMVQVVHDGESAIDVLFRRDFDLVLLDLNLPKLDGIEVLARVRPQKPQVRFVAMSAQFDASTRSRLLAAGAEAFITKPFGISELLQHVFPRQ
jgi:two-component system, OmpR family, response regulator